MPDRLTFYFVCGIHQLHARAERHAQEIAQEVLKDIALIPSDRSIVIFHAPGDCETFARKLASCLERELPEGMKLICLPTPWGKDSHILGFLLSHVFTGTPPIEKISPPPVKIVVVQDRAGTDQWATAYGGTSPFLMNSGTFFVATWPNGINRKQLEEGPGGPHRGPRAH